MCVGETEQESKQEKNRERDGELREITRKGRNSQGLRYREETKGEKESKREVQLFITCLVVI